MYELDFCFYLLSKIFYFFKESTRLDSLLQALQICLITSNLTLALSFVSLYVHISALDLKGRKFQVSSPLDIFARYPLQQIPVPSRALRPK